MTDNKCKNCVYFKKLENHTLNLLVGKSGFCEKLNDRYKYDKAWCYGPEKINVTEDFGCIHFKAEIKTIEV